MGCLAQYSARAQTIVALEKVHYVWDIVLRFGPSWRLLLQCPRCMFRSIIVMANVPSHRRGPAPRCLQTTISPMSESETTSPTLTSANSFSNRPRGSMTSLGAVASCATRTIIMFCDRQRCEPEHDNLSLILTSGWTADADTLIFEPTTSNANPDLQKGIKYLVS